MCAYSLNRNNNGAIVEARGIESVPPAADTLIFFTRVAVRRADLENIEKKLSEKTGKRRVVLDHYMEKVVGV